MIAKKDSLQIAINKRNAAKELAAQREVQRIKMLDPDVDGIAIDIHQDATLSKIFNRVAEKHCIRPDQVKALYCVNAKVMETALMSEVGLMRSGIKNLVSILPSINLLKRQVKRKKGQVGKPRNRKAMYGREIKRLESYKTTKQWKKQNLK